MAREKWEVRDGVIYLAYMSDGIMGPPWIERLLKAGIRLDDYSMSALLSPDFRPTPIGITTTMAILPGEWFFEENNRATTARICDEGLRRWELVRPQYSDSACYMREMLSDQDLKDMGSDYIAALSKPIPVYGCHVPGHLNVLGPSLEGFGHWLRGFCGKDDTPWDRHGAFALEVPPTK